MAGSDPDEHCGLRAARLSGLKRLVFDVDQWRCAVRLRVDRAGDRAPRARSAVESVALSHKWQGCFLLSWSEVCGGVTIPASMSRFRLLLAWLVLAALPLQGFAATSMLLCGLEQAGHSHAAAPVRGAAAHDHSAHGHATADHAKSDARSGDAGKAGHDVASGRARVRRAHLNLRKNLALNCQLFGIRQFVAVA